MKIQVPQQQDEDDADSPDGQHQTAFFRWASSTFSTTHLELPGKQEYGHHGREQGIIPPGEC